jgi:type IV pilus assembly protein PilY1
MNHRRDTVACAPPMRAAVDRAGRAGRNALSRALPSWSNAFARRRLTALLAPAVVTLVSGGALADDTEIFVQALPPGEPNVLLILDTSGSMAGELVVNEDYDPQVQYPGACNLDRLYYVRQSNIVEIPVCADDPLQYIDVAAFRCAAASEGLATAGFYTDRLAQWDRNDVQWERPTVATFGDPPGETRPVDCRADLGVHGDGIDLDAVYPTAVADVDDPANTFPWTAVEEDAIDWLEQEVYTFYSANYLNWLAADPETRISTRIDVLKAVGQDLLTGIGGLNMGVMRFSSNSQGGMVVQPVSDIDELGNRVSVIAALEAFQAGGDTPLAESLYEAQRYYSASPVFFGLNSRGNNGILKPSVDSSRNGTDYISPINQQCQINYVVLLTDGLPVSDTDADDRIEALTGTTCEGSCLDELTNWMATTDQSAAFEGDQIVETYTIGFFTDDPLLLDAATAKRPDGSPGYYTAEDVLELSDALRNVFEDIEESNTSFQSPAVAVDGFNRLVNSDELYFSMFIPSGAPFWAGNVKKYRLADVDGTMEVVDADGNVAVNFDGTFNDDARSEWSAEADGADVKLGGVRNRMGTDRRIYTDPAFAGNEVDLWLPENRFIESNELITAAMLNVEEAEREPLMRFLRGVDPDGNPNPIFGDPLHSNPTLVNFADGAGGTTLKMFLATNDGYFHALNVQPQSEADTLEDFAFIPASQLPRLWRLLENTPNNPSVKGYGLDGPISFWIKDDDGDNVVESGETLYVYFAMRRGGRNYFALRIPGDNPGQPTLAWTLVGGAGAFAELGESWSAGTVAKMKVGDSTRTVLVMGGGYDAASQDVVGPPQVDSIGRAIYIVDAETGQRLWWAGPADAGGPGDSPDLVLPEMTHSIPSDIAVIDSGGDGLTDRLYVGDMGGRVWRIDIEDLSDQTSGAVFADLGDDTVAGNRRFYYKPSVSRVLDERFGSFLSVSIGSGHRASPLSQAVDDRFFMLRDPYIFAPPADADGNVQYPTPITEVGLLDITDNTAPTPEALNAANGWVLRLDGNGEKSLSPPLTADGRVFFSTYLPEGGFDPTCNLAGVLGGGRLYEVELLTGEPVLLDDPIDDGLPLPEDRYQELEVGGIPPAPRLVFTPPPEPETPPPDGQTPPPQVGGTGCENPFSQVTLLLGTQARDPNICNAPVRTFWRHNRR